MWFRSPHEPRIDDREPFEERPMTAVVDSGLAARSNERPAVAGTGSFGINGPAAD